MPGPVFKGRCVVEVKVPVKQVFQHECGRCHRTWFADEEKKSYQISINVQLPTWYQPQKDGSALLGGSYSLLCDSCEKTVIDYVKAIFKPMKKISPIKSGAKKKGADAPLPEPKPLTDLGDQAQSASMASRLSTASTPSKKA